MLKYLRGRLPSASSPVRILNSSPLAAKAGLHLPDDQSDVHLPTAAVTATWPPAHSFSEKGQLLSRSTDNWNIDNWEYLAWFLIQFPVSSHCPAPTTQSTTLGTVLLFMVLSAILTRSSMLHFPFIPLTWLSEKETRRATTKYPRDNITKLGYASSPGCQE